MPITIKNDNKTEHKEDKSTRNKQIISTITSIMDTRDRYIRTATLTTE